MSHKISLLLGRRPKADEPIELVHKKIMDRMARIGPPLGFANLSLPPTPDCGSDLCATYSVKYPIRGLKLLGIYTYRTNRYTEEDKASLDDNLQIEFRRLNKLVDYNDVIFIHLPSVIEAFGAYRASASITSYEVGYNYGFDPTSSYGFDENGEEIRNNEAYNRLRADKTIDIDGRNNIFTLCPATFWDAELCRRALGYSPDEVVARLEGKVPQVRRLSDGVYSVFNDDRDLSFYDFLDLQERFKPILGLV